jgi:transcriptional regulator with XRE-family HTH domain
MITKKELAKKIRELREDLGFSQEQVAQRLGLPRPSISQMESARREVSSIELAKLAEILGVSPDFLLSQAPAKEPAKGTKASAAPRLDRDKFRQVLLYVLERCGARPNVGETVIYKLLYFIDFNFYELHERHLTGEVYRKISFGPAPCHFGEIVEKMIEAGEVKKITADYHGMPQKKYIPQVKPDLSRLDGEELRVIDSVIDGLSAMNASSIEGYSHEDIPWQVTDDKDIIDYESVFYRKPPYSVRAYPEER